MFFYFGRRKILIFLICLFTLPFVPTLIISGEKNENKSNVNYVENKDLTKQQKLRMLDEQLLMVGIPDPLEPVGLHMVVGNALVWCTENAVRPDGWQLTGYSKMSIDEDMKMSRLKIGIISPEIDAAVRYGENPDKAQWDEFERWRQQNQGIVVGIFWSKEF